MSLYIWITYFYLYSTTESDHLQLLDQVLDCLEKAGFRARKEKCQFLCHLLHILAIKLMQQAYIHFVTRFKLYKKLLPYKCTGIKSLLELAYLLHLSFPKISSYCVQTTTERRKVVMDSK